MKTDEGALQSALLEEAEIWPLYGYCCLTEELLRVNFHLKQADVQSLEFHVTDLRRNQNLILLILMVIIPDTKSNRKQSSVCS
jgi:hypothetical protein